MATVFEPIRPVQPITTIFMVDLPFSDDWGSLNGFEKWVRKFRTPDIAPF